MAKITVECPKCKTVNEVRVGLFAKKQMPCGRCQTMIDIAVARKVIKQCPYCGKMTVVDEAKVSNNKYICVSCHKKVNFLEAPTIRDVQVTCPHCRQDVMLPFDETNPEAECPICRKVIDVAVEFNKQTIIKNQTVSVIEYHGDNNTFIHKHEVENFKYGSTLIVNASQEAIFLNNGAILKVFAPGRYPLSQEFIFSLGGSVDCGDGAFSSKVYFINKTRQQGIRWAVPNVTVTDPEHNMQFKISLSGQLGLQVLDSRALLENFTGTTAGIDQAAFLDKDFSTEANGKTLGGFYRGVLIQNVNATLPSIITYNKLSLATINEHYRVLGEKIREGLNAEFAKIGLSVPDFTLESVFFPQIPENENYHTLVKLANASKMDQKLTERELERRRLETDLALGRTDMEAEIALRKVQQGAALSEAEAMALRKLQGIADDTEIIHETKETEKLRIAEEQRLIVEHNDLSLTAENIRTMGQVGGDVIRATGMAEADVIKAKGLAEGEVLHAKGMAEADAMRAKGYTGRDEMKHRENMEINRQLPELGTYFDQKDKEIFAQDMVREAMSIERDRMQLQWNCSCGNHGLTGAFCPNCGTQKAAVANIQTTWTCPTCGKQDNKENFCSECGTARPSVVTSWNCACGKSGINSKFCPSCGKQRP